MRNYQETFEKMKITVKPHIDPNPRCDLQKVYVFTDNTITEDQLRTDLEQKVGVQPNISDALAINCLLYVLPTEIPEEIAEENRNWFVENTPCAYAVFIRGPQIFMLNLRPVMKQEKYC